MPRQGRPWAAAVLALASVLVLPATAQHQGDHALPVQLFSQGGACEPAACAQWECLANRVAVPGSGGRDFETCARWACSSWNGGLCDKWNCTALGLPQQRYQETCDVHTCTSWNGPTCSGWECTKVDIPPANDRETCDRYECTLWTDRACRAWDCAAGDVPSADDLAACSLANCTSWFEQSCRAWDCTRADIPAPNDRESCYRYRCAAWRERSCAAWECVADNLFPGATRLETCFAWDCASWNSTRLPDGCSCSSNDACESGCCADGSCAPAALEGDERASACACRGGAWHDGQCCGDDFLESWCGEGGRCVEGAWVTDPEVVCTQCRHGAWAEGACCAAGVSACLVEHRCEDGRLETRCAGCAACAGGRCERRCDGSTCARGDLDWCDACADAEGDADDLSCRCRHGEWREGRCCGDDTVDEWLGEEGRCEGGRWVEGRPSAPEQPLALSLAETCGAKEGQELNDCLLSKADELSLQSPPDAATACRLIGDEGMRDSCLLMVIQRARGLDKLSVYLVYRPSHVLVPPFVLLALAALWVVRRRRAAAAPEPSQATGLSELQFQMQGLVTALDHLYRTLAVADVLAYGHARRLDEHVVADFLNNERSILELEKRMTAEELDAVVTARVYLMLGNVQFLRGDHEAAKKRYEHGLRLDKGSAALWNDLGLAFHHMGDHERAEKCLRKAQELAPDDQTVLLNLGRLFGAKAHLARAATWQAPYGAVPAAMRARSLSWDYGRASKMASWGSPPAWKEASLEREQAAFYDQQEEVYARVLERDPDNLEALVGLGMALRHKGAPDRSLQLLERAAALAPQNGAILYELARLYDAKGDTKRAVEHYRRCRDALHMR